MPKCPRYEPSPLILMSFRARVRTLVKVCSHDAALLEFMLEVLVHMSRGFSSYFMTSAYGLTLSQTPNCDFLCWKHIAKICWLPPHRYDQEGDRSQHYLNDHEENPSRNNDEVSSYYLGTLESSKNSGLSSSSYELSQYINGAEQGETAHTSAAGEWTGEAPSSQVHFTQCPAWHLLSTYFLHPQIKGRYITRRLLWSTPSLTWLLVLGLQASWSGSRQACPPRRTSASWRSTVWRSVQQQQQISIHIL